MSSNKKHDFIERCLDCGQFLTYTQAKTHKCPSASFIKEIYVKYLYQVPDATEKTVIAHGYDGLMYRLVEKPSDDSYHGDKNGRRLNRTEKSYCLNM
jgi:hypothetical protein